jgi:signal peptidase I
MQEPHMAEDLQSHWRPRPSNAFFLNLLAAPLGMLYARQPRWALIYLGIKVLLAVLVILAMSTEVGRALPEFGYRALGWTVALVCAFHSHALTQSEPPKGDRAWYSRWYGLVGVAASAGTALFLFRAFGFENFRVPGQAMYPTVAPGSLLWIRKLGYGNYGAYGLTLFSTAASAPIARGDMVAFRKPTDPRLVYVSRIIGRSGDEVAYVDWQLTINGVRIPTTRGEQDSKYLHATEIIDGRVIPVAWMPQREPRNFDEVVVPVDHYLVLGDSRDDSRDSRFDDVGMVPAQSIIGVVTNFRPSTLTTTPAPE